MANRDAAPPDRPLGGRYQLLEAVGEGSFSITYRARDLVLERTVAVKVLRSHHAAAAAFVARFEREARLAAAVAHPNVVDVYDFGRDGDTLFLVMRFVPGPTLKQELANRGRFPPAEAVRLVAQVLRGLAAIHAAGIIHRDVKPQNVLLGAEEPGRRAYVTDFGVAYLPSDGSLTGAGATAGTAAYMAPEQALGGLLGEATDLYAVGVILFELLTGRLPFAATTPVALMVAHLEQPPPRPSAAAPAAALPPALDAEVLRALAKDPSHRHAGAEEMALALEAAVGIGPPPRFAPPASRPPALSEGETTPLPAYAGATWAGAASSRRPAAPFVPPPARRRAIAWAVPLAIFCLAVVALGGLTLVGGFPGQPRPSPVAVAPDGTSTPTATVMPSPSPTASPRPTIAPTATAIRIATLPAAAQPAPSAPTATPRVVAPPPTAAAIATPRPRRTPRPSPTLTPSPTATDTAPPTPTVVPTTTSVATATAQATAIPTSTQPPPTAPPDPAPGALAFAARQWRDAQDCPPDRYDRPCVAIYGRESEFARATLRFDLAEVPAERLVLTLTGLGDPSDKPFPFAIAVNGIQTDQIPRSFPNWDPDSGAAPPWTTIQISLPAPLFAVGANQIAVVSLRPGSAVDRPPFILLADAQLTPRDAVADTSAADSLLAFDRQPVPTSDEDNDKGKKEKGNGNNGRAKDKEKDE